MKKFVSFMLMALLPMLAGIAANAQELTVSDIEYIDEEYNEGYNEEYPMIILTMESSVLNVHLLHYSAHPNTEEFVIIPMMSGGSDGDLCSVSIGVSYINYLETSVITTFDVSFNIHGIEDSSFYLSCWWFKGQVTLTEGEPLELWENKNISKDRVTYTLNNKTKTATLSSGRHVEGECKIPSELDYGGQTFLLTNIDYPAFAFNTSLTSVIIPKSVTNIGNAVFYLCYRLTDVYCYAENVPETGINVFKDCPIASATLHVPAGSIEAYKATAPWKDFGTIVGIPEEYYPEGTRWTEIRLDTLKYDSWYSKVDGEWVPNFETIEYCVEGTYPYFSETFGDNSLKCVYTNCSEWTDSLSLLIVEGKINEYLNYGRRVMATVPIYFDTWDVPSPAMAYNFDWRVGMPISFIDILSTTYDHNSETAVFGIIEEINEGNFGGVRPLSYTDVNGVRFIQGIGVTTWNDGECIFGPVKPYEALSAYGAIEPEERHYRSMLVHFERDGEVLYDVWPATYGQLFKPLGMGIETPNDWVTDFQPQMYVEGNILYVCTKQGLYSKDLSKDESEWQLVGFEGIPILDYVRRGEDIFALCFNDQKDIFLLSHDSGQTYEDVTPDDFRSFINREGHTFWYFNQHPTDPDAFLLTSYHGPGMFMTTDFGQTWEKLADYTPDYMGFHPLTPEIIYECGGGGFTDEKTDLRISYDGGQTWQDKTSCFPDYGTLYRMAFHPTDPDKWIVGGKRCLYTTDDGGKTWDTQSLCGDGSISDNYDYNIDWRYTAYDNEDADIIYMAGGHQTQHMKLICSTDGGKTWNRPYLEPIKTSPTEYVFDMKQYGDKLLIYSQSDVYMVSKADLIAQTTPVTFTSGQMATIILPTTPDASKGKYYRLDRYEDGQIIFEQELQPQAHIPYIIVPNEDFSIDLSTLDLAGCYRDTVSIAGISFIGSYVSETFDYPDGFYIDFIDITHDCRFDESCVIGALRAYLLVRWDDPYNQGGTRVPPLNKRGILLRDYETGITSPLRETEEGAIFDLQGRKVSNPQKGIYIKEGRKVLIK